MPDQYANKIKRLELKNFTCFEKVEFDFSPGINVIIGENGTGKTHLLKVLYGVKEGKFRYPPISDNEYTAHVEDSLIDVFNIPDIIELKSSRNEIDGFHIKIIRSHVKYEIGKRGPISIVPYFFIPVIEMLSWQENFIGNNLNRESGFDKIWFDLAIALDRGLLKGKEYDEAKKLVKQLEEVISAEVVKKDRQFFFRFKNNGQSEQNAAVVAQGINKIGQIIYLILNGSITKNSILFWDEPEANLNPKYITIVAKFLQTLANAGVQIFVASHDYLLVQELSLLAEYKKEIKNAPDIKFFALYKGEDGSTQVEEGKSMAHIQNDAIIQEFVAHDAREKMLWKQPS